MYRDQDERARLDALRSYAILDTRSEAAFDEIAAMAAELCDVPIAVVSLVDEHRQWSKAAHGCPRGEVERSRSFCTHAITRDEALVVHDATRDPRFAHNAMVTGEPHIRFYAGQPLRDGAGHALGSLCLIDRRPRALPDAHRRTLRRLAAHVIHLLELRRGNRELAACLQRVDHLAQLVPMCGHCHAVRSEDDRWQRIEHFLRDLNGARFTHGVCPACMLQHYPPDVALPRR